MPRTVAERGHRGIAAPSQPLVERPVGIVLPDGTRMRVEPVTAGPEGALRLPPHRDAAGWWAGGSRMGELFGPVVVAAHVDSHTWGIGPFAQLLTTRAGDRVGLVTRTRFQEFEVRSSRFLPREQLRSESDPFSPYGPIRLVLITCGGPYDSSTGGYRDNVVVVAEPVGSPQQSATSGSPTSDR